MAVELENQTYKIFNNTKKSVLNFVEDDSILKQKAEKGDKNPDTIIKRTSLDEPSDEFHVEFKYPQGLPLIARKIRKCPDCKKPLTTVYRGRPEENNRNPAEQRTRHGEQKIELMHKDIKILLCQYITLTSNKAKVKLLKDATIEGEKYKKDDVVEV